MKLVIFGLSISSSWGNGHATLWRALCRALGRRGHRVVFFERDLPYYAPHRDSTTFDGCELRLYSEWHEALEHARRELRDADVAMVTSYCPDGAAASDLVLQSQVAVRSFYDLDTPVTFARIDAGEHVDYLPHGGLSGFDVVLSYTGGEALRRLQSDLGARHVAPLYGSVDPDIHRPADPVPDFAGDISYLGTYAEDRQEALVRLFVEPARLRPEMRFVIGGAQYPQAFPWTSNIYFVRHLAPSLHGAFYSSSRMTLNVTRQAMAACGYCPSGRLFEAAACGAAVVTDVWEGLDDFYRPGTEMIFCRTTEDVLNALSMSDAELERMRRAARERTLSEHTAAHRAAEFEVIMQEAGCRMAQA